MTTITVQMPAQVAVPPAARWVGTFVAEAIAFVQRVQAARIERRRDAERIAEANAVRDYARRFARHDPRFVADLMAAADRHERTAA